MKDRIRSKRYPGVYYRLSTNKTHNGKPDRIFWFCYSIAGKVAWVRVGQASHGITEEYTNQKRIEFLNKMHLGENPASLIRKDATSLDEIVTSYFAWRNGNDSTTKADQSRYDVHIKKLMGHLRITAINADMLDKLKARLSENLSPASVKKVFTFLRAAVNLAIKRKKYTGLNPFSAQADFAMPQEDNKGERFLTPSEAQRLLDDLEKRSLDLYHMALVSLRTGMRATEIFGLTGSDIDKEAGHVNITAKGRKREIVPVPPDIMEILVSRISSPEMLLFPDRQGIRRKSIPRTFDRAVNALGMNDGITDNRHKIWFHTLRHTFASWLAQSGKVTLQEIMALMRHKRVEMSLRYAHLIPGQQREKLSIISDILGQQPHQ